MLLAHKWNNKKLRDIFLILKEDKQLAHAPVVYFMSTINDGSFKILISTVLSLRTKDEVTGPATERLFQYVKNPIEMLQLSAQEIEQLIYPVGFYKTKAKRILEISEILKNTYHSVVPRDLELLLSFPGVGRKTANLVMSVAFDEPAVCVDVHVHRITNRWGLCCTKTPEETEFYIRKHISQDLWQEFNRPLVALGQMICKPRSPKCSLCSINSYCDQIIANKNN